MTLEELTQNITIQGDIRLSVWKDSEEVLVVCVGGTECLANQKDIRKMLGYEVLYIFAAPDGYLHIELAAPED